MGKKLSRNQVSTKISKEDKKKQQHQLNTMINILRPKVYITHSSDFKRLVQELTGNSNNGNHNYSPLSSSTPQIHQQPSIIEITESEDYHHHHPQENTSPVFSIDASSDADRTNSSSNNNNINNNNNKYVDDILSSYDSPLGAEIVVPDDLYSMLLDEAEGYVHNNMEHRSPPHKSDDLVSLSPPSSSSSCDWQLEMMDPFISYNNFYHFDDACFNSFNVPKEQALYHHQEACVFENIELLQW